MTESRRVLGVVAGGGAVGKVAEGAVTDVPSRDPATEALAARARELLREEVAVGDPAALQGACRLALRLGLISPGEAREILLTSRHTDEGKPG